MTNSTESIVKVLAPAEALSSVLGAGANFNLAAERLKKAGYTLPDTGVDNYLASVIASDPSFFSSAQLEIRTHVMLQVLKLFSKVQSALEGAITKLDPYEAMKAWNQIASTIVTLSTPPPQPNNVNNFNSLEFFMGQVPPRVREAMVALIEAGDMPQDNNNKTIEHEPEEDHSSMGNIWPYLGHGGDEDD